jgi:translocator protein
MTDRSKRSNVLGLVGWLVLSYAVSAIGAAASLQAQSFYGELSQPSWAPPAWLFGPVWTALFTAMGVASWLVWREGEQRRALSLFIAQLTLNGLWSWLFFAWRLGGLAFADIVVLWILILLTTVAFWRARPLAGALLVPYLLWVSFAAALNYALWQLNPEVLG